MAASRSARESAGHDPAGRRRSAADGSRYAGGQLHAAEYGAADRAAVYPTKAWRYGSGAWDGPMTLPVPEADRPQLLIAHYRTTQQAIAKRAALAIVNLWM